MGDQHLQKLESALLKKGWSVLERETKIDWYSAGTWTIQRSTKTGPFHLTFVAMDHLGVGVYDLPSAWSCHLSEDKQVSLYFYKLKRFDPEVQRFVAELDRFESQALEKTKHA
jgi:hypothetical protein